MHLNKVKARVATLILQTLEQRQLLETREGHYNSDKRISPPGIQS